MVRCDNDKLEELLGILDLSLWQFYFLEAKRGTAALNLILMSKERLIAEVEVTMFWQT